VDRIRFALCSPRLIDELCATQLLQSLKPSTKTFSFFALPALRVRFPARLLCQGSSVRFDERKARGLDSACGKAPGAATKGICFFFSSGNHARKKEERENQMPERQHATWGDLLREAIEKPGRMLEAYTAFHNYSFGNALLALEQCARRNLQPGPLNTYNGWLERKRQVRKGEKGITLCMPMACKRNAQAEAVPNETAEPQICYAFRFRAYWFVLAQTEGEDTPISPIPCFDIDTTLRTLNITRTPFDKLNGNIQGFANGRDIAVNPVAGLPHKTLWIANKPHGTSARSKRSPSR